MVWGYGGEGATPKIWPVSMLSLQTTDKWTTDGWMTDACAVTV